MPNQNFFDVIVVGAGIAGLAAAHELSGHPSLSVLVLEAQNYIGGRVKTSFVWGMPIELGAEFIHGKQSILGKLADDLRLDMREAFSGHTLIDRDGKQMSAQVAQVYESVIDYVFECGKQGISVAKLIGNNPISLDPEICELARHFFEDFEAASADEIDSGALSEAYKKTKFLGGEIVFRNGYCEVIDYFTQGVHVELNKPVTHINWEHPERAVLYAADGTAYTARRVIVTCSLGVLKSGIMKFMPSLPAEKQLTINRLAMGNACKVLLRLRSADTARRIFRIANATSESLLLVTNWWESASNERVLVGYVGGPRTAAITALSDVALKEMVTKELSKVFGEDFKEEVEEVLLARWDNNPYIQGVYSYHPVGVRNRDREALAMHCGALYWAGEATQIDGTYAMVHGAIASGYRAAKEALASLQR